MPRGPGTVYLVGAGPGDPGLLTRRGEAVLSRADVVVYDHLASSRLLDLAPADALLICAGKSIGHCTLSPGRDQSGVDRACAGGSQRRPAQGGRPARFRARCRGGIAASRSGNSLRDRAGRDGGGRRDGVRRDPGDAPRGGLGRRIRDRTRRPGIRSRTEPAGLGGTGAVSGHAGRVHGGHSSRGDLSYVDAPGQAGRHAGRRHRSRDPRLAAHRGRHLGDDRADRAQAAACIPLLSWSSAPSSPCGNELAWYERLPLFGQTDRDHASRARKRAARRPRLEALGAEVLLAPTVGVRPITDPGPLDAAIDRLADYDWLVFTSANGVRFFLRRLEQRGRDLRALGHLKLAAIGPATAEALAQFHLRADLVPASYRSEALAAGPRPACPGTQDLARPRRSRTNHPQGGAATTGRCRPGRRLSQRRCRVLAGFGCRTNPGWHDRLDHPDQLGHHDPVARPPTGSRPRASGPRGPPGQLEPGHVGGGRSSRMERRGGSERIHVGWADPGTRGPNRPRPPELGRTRTGRGPHHLSSSSVSTPCQNKKAAPKMNMMSITRLATFL